MTNATILSGVLAILSMLCALVIAVICLLKGYDVKDIAIASGVFVTATLTSIGFFMGHSNGVTAIQEAEQRGAARVAENLRP